MIFETYIVEYFKIGIVDSHSLGYSRTSLVYVLLFSTTERERCIQTFSKYCAIAKYETLKTNT